MEGEHLAHATLSGDEGGWRGSDRDTVHMESWEGPSQRPSVTLGKPLHNLLSAQV